MDNWSRAIVHTFERVCIAVESWDESKMEVSRLDIVGETEKEVNCDKSFSTYTSKPIPGWVSRRHTLHVLYESCSSSYGRLNKFKRPFLIVLSISVTIMIITSEDNLRVIYHISIALNQCSYQCRVGWHFEEETEALHLACSVLLVAIDNFAEEVTQRSTSSERRRFLGRLPTCQGPLS